MKCPKCSKVQKYKQGLTCLNCKYRFILDPKQDQFSDGKFLAAIRSASNNGTAYFTTNQLYAAVCRKNFQRPTAAYVVLGIVAGVALGISVLSQQPVYVYVLIVAGYLFLCLIAYLITRYQKPVAEQAFRGWLRKWEKKGSDLEKFITRPGLGNPPPEWKERDIYDYGVERLLIVQHDVLVDLFVLNGVHATERALIVSETGYPRYLLSRFHEALKNNPEVPIFLLHDSDTKGMGMEQRVRTGILDLGNRPVVDLGLTPQDAARLDRLNSVGARGRNFEVPVDFLGFAALQLALAGSLEAAIPLATLIDQRNAQQDTSSSSFG